LHHNLLKKACQVKKIKKINKNHGSVQAVSKHVDILCIFQVLFAIKLKDPLPEPLARRRPGPSLSKGRNQSECPDLSGT